MNREKYSKALHAIVHNNPIDISFLSKWFENTIEQLNILAKQRSAIRHPRYRGDAREDDFTSLLKQLLPPALKIERGFVANEYGATSQEQDCLILDGRLAAPFVASPSTTYYPHEAVAASVEIKSKLTLPELRKIALNCASLKKLGQNPILAKDAPRRDHGYFVFAYESSWSLEDTCKKVREVLAEVPVELRPNMFYILKSGFLLPQGDSGFKLGPPQMFTGEEFHFQGAMSIAKSIPSSDAIPFLWFLTNILDHCVSWTSKQQDVWFGRYVFSQIVLQQQVERLIKEHEAKPNGS